MVADEPALKLVGAEHIANDQIIRALIAGIVGCFRDVEAGFHDDFVRLKQARDLHRYLFAADRRRRDAGVLGDIAAHCDRYAAEELDTFSDGVDNFHLLFEMLIKKEDGYFTC